MLIEEVNGTSSLSRHSRGMVFPVAAWFALTNVKSVGSPSLVGGFSSSTDRQALTQAVDPEVTRSAVPSLDLLACADSKIPIVSRSAKPFSVARNSVTSGREFSSPA